MAKQHVALERCYHQLCKSKNTVVPGFSVLGFRALPGFRALCTGNQILIYVINLPGFSALPGFKAPFHGNGQSGLNPGTTVSILPYRSKIEHRSNIST